MQIARNVTTNELANWHRYRYMRTPDGAFTNPFDRGIRRNCWEAFNPALSPTAPVMLHSEPHEMISLLAAQQQEGQDAV